MKALEFVWLSPLGISVLLFLVSGIFRILIGCLTPFFMDSKITEPSIIMTSRADEKLFGESPSRLLEEDKALHKTRNLILTLLAGVLVIAGIFMVSLAWFGLRGGHWWPLVTLAVAGVAELPFWISFIRHYTKAGVHLTLADIPPFIWIPQLLLVPAIILAIIGLKQL